MAFLHSHVQRSQQTSRTVFLEFFFSGRGDALQKSPVGMFRSLLHQIYNQVVLARSRILEAFEEKTKGSGEYGRMWEWHISDLEKLLGDVVREVATKKEVTIFVDALDEAVDERGEKAAQSLLHFFHELNASAAPGAGCLGGVKVCVSCRHYPIQGSFGPGLVIEMEKENGRDVWNFIHDNLQNGVYRWSDEPAEARQRLVDGIAQKADGVFQWASLRVPKIVRSLNDGDATVEDIIEIIAAESNELFPLYELIFANDIPVRLRKRALFFLQWVCFAERPLSMTELRFAMVCDGDEDGAWPRYRCEESKYFVKTDAQMEKLTKSLSGGLVEVRHHKKGSTVQFIHGTVVEFLHLKGLHLLMSKVTVSAVGSEWKSVGQSQSRLTRSCINYLGMEKVMEEAREWLDGEEKQPALLDYATKSWFLHAEKAERNAILQEKIVSLFGSKPGLFELWANVIGKMKPANRWDLNPGLHLLHVAAISNLCSVVHALLLKKVPVGIKDVRGMTALHLAAFHGHEEVVVMLLDSQIEIDAMSNNSSTPLQHAVANSHESVAKLLLKRGANINENTSRSGSALQAAAAEGALPFVQFLIENGADVNARSGDPRTSLQIAAAKGHEAVVQLLIAKGADVNVKADGNYVEDGSALHIAAFIGYEKVCRLLLDAGAEVNSESGEYGYALHAAVRRPYNLNLVRLLLERDADVNAFGGRYGTALQSAAAYPDNQAIIQLLLDRGANDREGGWLGSAFLAAVGSGSEDNIRILIAHGINTNAEGGKYGDALQASVVSGQTSLVQYFLDNGANVNASGGEHGTALHAATKYSEAAVDLLLERGANVNVAGPEFGSVLNAAVHWGRESVIQKLLTRGAKIICDETHLCAFEEAARWGNLRVLKILLDYGAEINCLGGGWRKSALQNAVSGGHRLAVGLLLDKGADINFYTARQGTPLGLAIMKANKPIVELLLERGADPNLPGVSPTALELAEGNKTITRLLVERGARQSSVLENVSA